MEPLDMRTRLIVLFVACYLALSYAGSNFAAQSNHSNDLQDIPFNKEQVFDEVISLVTEHFMDQAKVDAKWSAAIVEFKQAAASAKSYDAFANSINGLLATFGTSHTRYFSQLDPKRFQLAGIFKHSFPSSNQSFCYAGVGIDTVSLGNRTIIKSVFDGFPANKAGLKFGDQILSVDGQPFHPIGSFKGRAGKTASFSLMRNNKPLKVAVSVVELDGRTMFENALKSSVRVINKSSKQIGYVHVWSYAGTQYQEELKSQILWGDLKDCDTLIVDLRDGWGGADINYLNLFRKPIAVVEATDATGNKNSYSGVWGKPVALLVNENSTSGKELFSHGFKKLKLGKVIGENTAGAVVAGRCFPLSNGDILYLAVSDVQVDGLRLEGQGVAPDIRVQRQLESPKGSDPQLEAAIESLIK